MNSFLEVADRLSNKILEVLQRFPLASLSSFIVTILSILLIEANSISTTSFMLISYKILLVATLGIFLFPALHLLSKKLWFKLVGLILLVLYFYTLPINIFDSVVFVRHGLLILALMFMFLWAPFMDIHISNENIWEWTQNILLIALASILLTAAFYVIFFVTMYSIEELFGYRLEAKRYLQVFMATIGLFSINYFLGHMPKYIVLLQKNRYADIGSVFTKFILTPIFFIYLTILVAYIVKITLDKSWISVDIDSMAVGYAIVAISTYIYWTPLSTEDNKKFRKLIWGSTLLLSIVLGLSIWVRAEVTTVEAYYLILLFTSWLATLSIYFLFFREASYKWLFFSISFFIVVSQSESLIKLSVNLTEKVSLMF